MCFRIKPIWGSRGEHRRATGKMIRWTVFQARTGARVPQAKRGGRAFLAAKGLNSFTQTKKIEWAPSDLNSSIMSII